LTPISTPTYKSALQKSDLKHMTRAKINETPPNHNNGSRAYGGVYKK